MKHSPKLLWAVRHSATQVSVGKITREQCGREIFGWLRGTQQLKLTIIPKHQSDGEITKLSNVASWHQRFHKLKMMGQMMTALLAFLKQSFQSPAWFPTVSTWWYWWEMAPYVSVAVLFQDLKFIYISLPVFIGGGHSDSYVSCGTHALWLADRDQGCIPCFWQGECPS